MAELLVVFTCAPEHGLSALETRDLALAALAFDHVVDALFLGEGLRQLLPGQAAATDTVPGLRALQRHGLRAATVLADELEALGLQVEELALPAQRIARADLPALYASCTHCVGDADWVREAERHGASLGWP